MKVTKTLLGTCLKAKEFKYITASFFLGLSFSHAIRNSSTVNLSQRQPTQVSSNKPRIACKSSLVVNPARKILQYNPLKSFAMSCVSFLPLTMLII